ncbi:hypothetical protein Elgi_36970 [Paenibacillus elgii]|uniref:hypothetical protein n=1 Tax=Paenibacillus elgii TaxID=189691 RepID=UPI002D7BD4CE|nr:hypothetical protein Elgi_36970 [Paenibacillus elgii]
MIFSIEESLTQRKTNDIEIYQNGHMWVCIDKEIIGIGEKRNDAIENYKYWLNKKYELLKEKVERDLEESRRKHRELWNY